MAPRALYQHIRSPSADRTATPRASKPYATLAVSPRAPPAAQRAEECPRSQPAQSDGCLMQCCATQFPRREHRQNQRATLRASKTYATLAVSPRAPPAAQRAVECPRSQPAQSDGCLMQRCATQFPRRERKSVNERHFTSPKAKEKTPTPCSASPKNRATEADIFKVHFTL